MSAEMVMNNHSNNNNDEWYTPPEFVNSARWVMGGIDLDPASNAIANENVGALEFYSLENSAFLHTWRGRVWMNPPYSRVIKDFVNKLVDEYDAGNVTEAVVVTNNGTDTQWFHRLAGASSAICMVKGRIGFQDADGVRINNNNKGQIFTYLGDDPETFKTEFEQYGLVFIK
ncbi:MAG: DNA N-6-adenine-methyltransferase [Fusobacteriaceae bacterium]